MIVHYLLSICLCVVSINSIAQKNNSDDHFIQSIDGFFGQKFLQNETLNGAVGSLNETKIGAPFSFVGFSVTSILVWNRRSSSEGGYSYPCTMGFYHILPQKIALNDSVSGRVSGFNVRIPLAGFDVFRKSKSLDLVMGAGFNTGRIRLFGDARLEQVNAYFAPLVSISPRVKLGKFSFQLRAAYELDITRSRWRSVWFSDSPKADLGPIKSTGLSASISLGWILPND